MQQRRSVATLAFATVASLTATFAAGPGLTSPAGAAPRSTTASAPASGSRTDVGDYSSDYFSKPRSLDRREARAAVRQGRTVARGAGSVGEDKLWPAVDFVTGRTYLKRYRLRGQDDHIQFWVANDRAFPTDDCRNDLGITDITQRQVRGFIRQFENRILPTESKAFSIAPDQNGEESAELAAALGLPETYWKVSRRHADDTVVLVDNVRDENYFTPNTPEGQTRVGGFFSPSYTTLFDRNIMTIDSYDWRHLSGANPPDDSDDPAYVACGEELGAVPGRVGAPSPRKYEATFAHEYQHLLESYEDPDEVSWVNEGLSDYAQTLTGYVNTKLPVGSKAADSHIACFQGFFGRRFGGPENSLTLWQDQGAPEILCDYGAAYTFMQYLFDQYGEGFLSALHRQNRNGIHGLQRELDRRAGSVKALTVIHRWLAMSALDSALDRNGGNLVGGRASRFRAATLKSHIKWVNPQSYNTDGAPLNGADFVRLRDGSGHFLSAGEIDSIDFQGSTTVANPVEWTVDATPPDATTEETTCGAAPDGTGAAALYSGCGDEQDRSIVRSVSVPATGPATLSFDTLFDTEEGWDFGFVQASTDNGQTWTSLATEDTTTEHNPDALPYVVSELPGFTGDSGGWTTQTADLSAYAGQDVLIGFRYITDPGAAEAGMWVRNIDAAGTPLPSGTLAGWRTITQLDPHPVPGYTVQLISYGAGKQPAYLARLRVDAGFHGTLTGPAVADALGTRGTKVAAIVMADDPAEVLSGSDPTKSSSVEVPYALTVNGVVQPGGGDMP